mmetsp:Transcript_101480/g.293597  ORF Transcript_101480/g.293597 Transcript_101480/m.293597 type:complete len:280 (+) Transcript_101480:375-1214(+)
MTSTGRVCPMRWQRSTACASTAGDHQGSQSTTMFPAVKFTPAPTAFRPQSATFAVRFWNAAMWLLRSWSVIEPSMRTKDTPPAFNSRSKTRRNCEKAEKITIDASLGLSRTNSSKAATLALAAISPSAISPGTPSSSSAHCTSCTCSARHSGQRSAICAIAARRQSSWNGCPHFVMHGRGSARLPKQMEHSSSCCTKVLSAAWRAESAGGSWLPPANAFSTMPSSFCNSRHNCGGSNDGEQQSCLRRSNMTNTSAILPDMLPATPCARTRRLTIAESRS